MKGKVKFYNEKKGFGFISAEDGNDYFVHSTELAGAVLHENDEVNFEIGQGDRGPKATKVTK